jgi:capsular exopolysaccharide synthesis family protein
MNRLFDTLSRLTSRSEPGLTTGANWPETSGHTISTTPELPAAPGKAVQPSYRNVSLKVSATAPLLPFEDKNLPAAEQYRIIRTKILHHRTHPKIIAISSAGRGDGKTTTSINIAGALALRKDVTVLLIDTDMRQSTMADQLGIPQSPGLGEVLAGAALLQDAIVHVTEIPNLYILPAGESETNPAELLDSAQWRALAQQCSAAFRYVILDATPVEAVTDYELVEQVADGLILVARPDHTDRAAYARAESAIQKGKLLGTVLNGVPSWFGRKSHGAYHYYAKPSARPNR